jgi:hypothetical protein
MTEPEKAPRPPPPEKKKDTPHPVRTGHDDMQGFGTKIKKKPLRKKESVFIQGNVQIDDGRS